MSNNSNVILLERTAQVIDDLGVDTPSHDIETLERMIRDNDFEALQDKVSRLESFLAQENFHELEMTDTFWWNIA